MKVRYTLPGIGPHGIPAGRAEPAEEGAGSAFRRLIRLPAARSPDWRALLGLDRAPDSPARLSPPPKPPGIESRDAAGLRVYFRSMLERHAHLLRVPPHPADGEAGRRVAVQRMLSLLNAYQELEDAVLARHLAEPYR